ncbi:MAG: hypothetical protein ABEJ96_04345, partial [Thiohalorhabdaceae bacterium]
GSKDEPSLVRGEQSIPLTPSLTLSEAKFLLNIALPRRSLNVENALAILKYRKKRKHAAYLSHRKKRLVELQKENEEVAL